MCSFKLKLDFNFTKINCIVHFTTSTPPAFCDGACTSNDDCQNGRVCNMGLDGTAGTCCLNQKRGMYHFPFNISLFLRSSHLKIISISTIYSKLTAVEWLTCAFNR